MKHLTYLAIFLLICTVFFDLDWPWYVVLLPVFPLMLLLSLICIFAFGILAATFFNPDFTKEIKSHEAYLRKKREEDRPS